MCRPACAATWSVLRSGQTSFCEQAASSYNACCLHGQQTHIGGTLINLAGCRVVKGKQVGEFCLKLGGPWQHMNATQASYACRRCASRTRKWRLNLHANTSSSSSHELTDSCS
jgi:hypothetical protein